MAMVGTLSRIALGMEYDGSGFCGWQTQASGCAVQDAVDAALSRIAAQRIESHCAGRTDAGVHALGQVIHFDTSARRPLTAWVRGVNACLPDTIAVKWAREVTPEFHARYAARGRAYFYLLLNRPERPGIGIRRVGWCHRPLDLSKMREAAAHLLGRHDFSSFRAAQCQAKSPLKEMKLARIDQVGSLLVFGFAADAFLHHMVRNIVGSLVHVGAGARSPQWMKEVLETRDRRAAAPTFSASGLYLSAVQYDTVWGFPEPDPPIEALMLSGLSS